MRATLALALLLAGIPARPALPQAPSWLLHRPQQEGYLAGIGAARKTGDLVESRERAFSAALHDLAAQVRIALQAEVEVEEQEQSGRLEQEYMSQVSTKVTMTLEGVELVDTWEDAQHCWAYARLSQEQFARRGQERIEAARDKALELFCRAEEARLADAARALGLYLQALEPLQQAPGEALKVVHQGRSFSLALEVPLRLQDLLSAISLEAAPVEATLRAGEALDVSLTATAHLTDGAPVRDLPLCFRFVQGTGELDARVQTDVDGRAVCRLRRIGLSGASCAVEAWIDLPANGRPFAAPSARFCLSVRQPLVFLRCAESIAPLAPGLREVLAQRGLRLVDQPGQADLVVDLSGRIREGEELQELCFCYLDVVLTLRDPASEQEIFTASLTGIKAAGPTCEQAGFQAAAKAVVQLRQVTFPAAFDERSP